MTEVGVVVIARNEGERLKRCIASIPGEISRVVYVDSGSTDGSVAWARGQELEVVELDPSIPFTAARARNAGFERLAALPDPPALVQFVDGDCELSPGWLERGIAELARHERAVLVCGRLRERHPESTVYQRLFDLELDLPSGQTTHCGGIFLVRAAAFREAGGFRADLVAGEEPELCVRLRRAGGEIWRLDGDMAFHDADIRRFGQWWKRMVRGGHAYTEGALLHGEPREVRAVASFLAWGALLPLATLLGALWVGGAAFLALLLYPFQVLRIYLRERSLGRRPRIALAQAFFLVVSKFAQTLGMLRCLVFRLLRKEPRILEYKGAGTGSTPRPKAGRSSETGHQG